MPHAALKATLAAALLALGGATGAFAHGMHHGGGHHGGPAGEQAHPGMHGMHGHMHGMHGHMMDRMGHGGGHHGSAPAGPGGGAHRHGTPPAQGSTASPSNTAFTAASEKMHREMAVPLTGDADRDFAAMMIPHHQGAIDMARVQLQHGRDPEMRRVAEAVIREQEREIAELRAFLQRPAGR